MGRFHTGIARTAKAHLGLCWGAGNQHSRESLRALPAPLRSALGHRTPERAERAPRAGYPSVSAGARPINSGSYSFAAPPLAFACVPSTAYFDLIDMARHGIMPIKPSR